MGWKAQGEALGLEHLALQPADAPLWKLEAGALHNVPLSGLRGQENPALEKVQHPQL